MVLSSAFVHGVPESLHSEFLVILPRIERQARIHFHDVRCFVRRTDFIADAVALAWRWYVRLAERGKDVTQFVSALASFASKAVRSGRRVHGQESARDVMSRVAQRRGGFTVGSLPPTCRSHESLNAPHGQGMQDVLEERLHDNTVTPPPDQAAFRIDFPSWLCTLTARERRILEAMSVNESTNALSHQFGVSPGRISQMRREFSEGWQQFCGERDVSRDCPDTARTK